MTVFLTRINAVPLSDQDFSSEFNNWLSTMVDSVNETLKIAENVTFISEIITTPMLNTVNTIINSSYLNNNTATTTYALPNKMPIGSIVRIIGNGAGGWLLTPGSGQTIKVAGSSAGTSIASTSQYDCINIICTVENTTWVTQNSQTAGFTIV